MCVCLCTWGMCVCVYVYEWTTFYPLRPASQESMEVKGTIVVLGAYDYDILGKNDFMGICVVPCNDIPQLSNSSSLLDENSPKRRNMTLPLFHIGESKALLALQHHFSDHEAVEFLNVLRKSYHK